MVELFEFNCKYKNCNKKCDNIYFKNDDNIKSVNSIVNFSDVHFLHKNKKNKKTVNDLNIEFIIPVYQRKYCWDKEKIEKFLEILIKPFENNNKNDNFLGSFWFLFNSNKNNKYEYKILDGQQRITTIFLIFYFLKQNKKFIDDLEKNIKKVFYSLRDLFLINSQKQIEPKNINLKLLSTDAEELSNFLLNKIMK